MTRHRRISLKPKYFNLIPDMIQTRFSSAGELEMQRVFIERADAVCSALDQFRVDPSVFRVGLEVEYSLLGPDFTDGSPTVRDQIVQEYGEFVGKELGASQLESHIGPVDFLGSTVTELEKDYCLKEQNVVKSAQRQEHQLLRYGTNPFVPIALVQRTQNEFKYQCCPDFHNRHKCLSAHGQIGTVEKVDVRDATCVSLFNALHTNIDCFSVDDAIDKLNRSIMISPIATALGANGRLLDLKETGIADIRLIAWEISHDIRTEEQLRNGTRTRIGIPGSYYRDIHDYFNRMLAHPFILGESEDSRRHALEVAIGLNWHDARIKFFGKPRRVIVVEFRPVATQPSIVEDLAMVLFYLGRLLWSQQSNENLIPIEDVIEDKMEAMYKGIQATLHFHDQKGHLRYDRAKDFLLSEIERARQGLEKAGISPDYSFFLESLEPRLEKGEPASISAETFRDFLVQGYSRVEALSKTFFQTIL